MPLSVAAASAVAVSCLAAAVSTRGLGPRAAPLLSATELSRTLYAVGNPLATGSLAVPDGYSVYWEEHGRKDGAPALFLHGGPGAGCARRHAGFFDPSHYRVILHDQRGCGKSGPKGSTIANETPRLVADIEALRVHMGIERWACVLGGSWGTTLALEYALAHPDRVSSIVVRAVCLMRSSEVAWLFGEAGGAARLSPGGWRSFAQLGEGPGLRSRGGEAASGAGGSALQQYAAALTGDDAAARGKAAGLWMQWEGSITAMGAALGQSAAARPWASVVQPASGGDGRSVPEAAGAPTVPRQKTRQEQLLWRWEPESARWLCGDQLLDTSSVEHALSAEAFEARVAAAISARQPPAPPAPPPPPPPPPAAVGAPPLASAPRGEVVPERWRRGATQTPPPSRGAPSGGWVPAQAILTCHYSVHSVHYGGFSGGDDAILSRIEAIRHIPCVAVQGGCDMICPPSTALDLHREWPEMDLRIVTGAGHSMYSPGLQAQILEATDRFRELATSSDSEPGNFRPPAATPAAAAAA